MECCVNFAHTFLVADNYQPCCRQLSAMLPTVVNHIADNCRQPTLLVPVPAFVIIFLQISEQEFHDFQYLKLPPPRNSRSNEVPGKVSSGI